MWKTPWTVPWCLPFYRCKTEFSSYRLGAQCKWSRVLDSLKPFHNAAGTLVCLPIECRPGPSSRIAWAALPDFCHLSIWKRVWRQIGFCPWKPQFSDCFEGLLSVTTVEIRENDERENFFYWAIGSFASRRHSNIVYFNIHFSLMNQYPIDWFRLKCHLMWAHDHRHPNAAVSCVLQFWLKRRIGIVYCRPSFYSLKCRENAKKTEKRTQKWNNCNIIKCKSFWKIIIAVEMHNDSIAYFVESSLGGAHAGRTFGFDTSFTTPSGRLFFSTLKRNRRKWMIW